MGNACCAEHCAMDILLEELYGADNAEALVLGVGECAFYSRKIEFPDGRKNWAYELTDRELVFGDISGIRDAIRQMVRPDKILVCIVTCVPSLMNLDFSELETEFPTLGVIAAPHYKTFDKSELLMKLHKEILCR